MSDWVDLANPSEKSKSRIWLHFGNPIYVDENGKRETNRDNAVCRLCKTIVKNCKGTKNLWFHLQRHHPKNFSELNKPEDSPKPCYVVPSPSSTTDACRNTSTKITIPKLFDKKLHYPEHSTQYKRITDAVTNFIVGDLQPISVVDRPYFKSLLYSLDPKYKLPTRRYFKDKVIPNFYKTTRAYVEECLKNLDYIAITTDSWTSRATQSYITVTTHRIDSDWELRNHVIATRLLDEKHTGQNIGEALVDILNKFDIYKKQPIAIVTDNASNMTIAAKTAMLQPHIGCFAHTVNLACQKGVKVQDLYVLLGKVRRIASFFHKSTSATAILNRNQNDENTRKLIIDVSTRWNSTYDMINRYDELHEAVTKTLSSPELRKNAKNVELLSPSDVTTLESLICVLKPLKTITTAMCDTKTPTISLITVFKDTILKAMTVDEHDSSIVKSVKTAIQTDMRRRYTYPEVRKFLVTATALDPRFRKLPGLTLEERDDIYSDILEMAEMVDIQVKVERSDAEALSEITPSLPSLPSLPGMQSRASTPDLPSLPESSAENEAVVCEPLKKKARSAMEELLGDVYITAVEPALPSSEQARIELQTYRNQDACPLNTLSQYWWKQHENEFPRLSKLAKRYLHIPATSVPSERVFSLAGDVVTATRSCLKPSMVDNLIFLKHNMMQSGQ